METPNGVNLQWQKLLLVRNAVGGCLLPGDVYYRGIPGVGGSQWIKAISSGVNF